MRKKKNRITVSFNGINFAVRFSYPSALKNSPTPCRALVTPISPETGRLLTKRQLSGKESDCIVDRPVYGKSPEDILKNHIEPVLRNLLFEMQTAGLIDDGQTQNDVQDLATLAAEFEDTFFELHKNEWKSSTISSYRGQYKILMDEIKGCTAEDLTNEVYTELQYKICRHALETTRGSTQWSPGMEAPESAKKRLNLLYELILDLQKVSGHEIPVIPTRYNGKPSHDELLLARTDCARSLPFNVLQQLCSTSEIHGQIALLIDTGLRISECTGLLYGSLHCIQGSQGQLYYISVTGQFDTLNGRRTEFPKTNPSYRTIPVSVDLGRQLICAIGTNAKDNNILLSLMCNQLGGISESTNGPAAFQDYTSKFISGVLREEKNFALISNERAYTFASKKQEQSLWSMVTCHSLRRNFCTWLYCRGVSTQELYQQMGHAMKTIDRHSMNRGKTPSELYAMCLQKYVRSTVFSPAHHLRYNAGSKYTHTEVPACAVELSLPPNGTYEITIQDTEPQNQILVASNNLKSAVRYQESLPARSSSPEFLARDGLLAIQSKQYPFRSRK